MTCAHAAPRMRGRAALGLAPAIALLLWSAPSALAATAGASPEGPLLSGYGGPGAGQQAILGAQLVKGGGRGGGHGGGGAGGSDTAGAGTSQASSSGATPQASTSAEASGLATASEPASTAGGGGEVAAGKPQRQSAVVGGAPSTHARSGVGGRGYHPPQSTQNAVVAAQPLGLSGGDFIAVLLVACALLGVGLLTRSLARVPQ